MNKKCLLLVLPALMFVGCSEGGNTSSVPTQTAINKMSAATQSMESVDAMSVSMKNAKVKLDLTGMSYDDDGNEAGEVTAKIDLKKIDAFVGVKGIQALASETPDLSKLEASANVSVEGTVILFDTMTFNDSASLYVKDSFLYVDVSNSPILHNYIGEDVPAKIGASLSSVIDMNSLEDGDTSGDMDSITQIDLGTIYTGLVQRFGDSAVSELIKCTKTKDVYTITLDVSYKSVNSAIDKYLSYVASNVPDVTTDEISAAKASAKEMLAAVGFDSDDSLKYSVKFTDKYFVNVSLDAKFSLSNLSSMNLPVSSISFEASMSVDFKYGKDVVLDMPASFDDYTIYSDESGN